MLQEMEYVYAVYKEGSISRAAERMFISQPALSMALKRAEAKIGAALFDRSLQPMKLTSAGEIYIQKCCEIKLLEQEMKSQLNDLYELRKGSLTLGGTHFILSYILAPALSEFSGKYPYISLKVLECHSKQSETLLLDGIIDVYLRCSECSPGLERIAYGFSDYVLIAVPKKYISQYSLPKGYLTQSMVQKNLHLEQCPSVDFRLISHIPFLRLTDENNLGGRLRDLFKQHEAEPNIKMVVEQLTTSYYLAENGIGSTLASSLLIKNIASKNLIFYKIDSPLMVRHFHFVGRRRGYVSRACKEFIKILQTLPPKSPECENGLLEGS